MGALGAARAASTDDSGQALIEFALVLPLLALLTFGTIEVGLYLQAQSSLNATAFLGARAASTMGNDAGKTKQSIKQFTDSAGIGWLKQAAAQAQSTGGNGTSEVKLTAKVDRLTGMIGALTNGRVKDWKTITSQATLPLEYDGRTQGSGKAVTYKPETYRLISYENSYNLASVLTGRVETISGAAHNVGQVASNLAHYLSQLASSANNTPSPAPRPAGSPGTHPGPAPAPTPHAPSGSLLSQWAHDASQLSQAINGISTTTEPFSNTGAVEANPLQRGGAFSTGNLDSKVYLSPAYETAQTVALPDYDISSLVSGLKNSESAIPSLYQGGTTIQSMQTLMTAYPMLAPAGRLITAIQQPVKNAVGTMAGDADNAYKQAKQKEEQELFPRTP